MEGVSATAAGIVPDIDMSQISSGVSKLYILELPSFFFFYLEFLLIILFRVRSRKTRAKENRKS